MLVEGRARPLAQQNTRSPPVLKMVEWQELVPEEEQDVEDVELSQNGEDVGRAPSLNLIAVATLTQAPKNQCLLGS